MCAGVYAWQTSNGSSIGLAVVSCSRVRGGGARGSPALLSGRAAAAGAQRLNQLAAYENQPPGRTGRARRHFALRDLRHLAAAGIPGGCAGAELPSLTGYAIQPSIPPWGNNLAPTGNSSSSTRGCTATKDQLLARLRRFDGCR